MQSLRAVGYTTSAALADLVDNSVAAGAHDIAIDFSTSPDLIVSIVDDGTGMSPDELVAAMRFGSRDPRDPRADGDLGRFGLGMKTASLSQCRRVSVVSLKDRQFACAAWDLDECERRDGWWLLRPEASEMPGTVIEMLRQRGHGTAVIWQQLDRLGDLSGAASAASLEAVMEAAADHLALVFHRFLAGEIAGSFDIRVNNRPLPRIDPFLQGHVKGQALHPESFPVDGHTVKVSPFVLPFPSRLKSEELQRAGGREQIKTGHGFYVYRGGRLVVPGGWFRIVPSDELIRLARVRVDVPVELDHLWKVDIRKTVAEPPQALRQHLKRIVGDVTLRSRRVYTHRGTQQEQADRIQIWTRHDLRDGAAAWRINRDHPAVAALIAITGPGDGIERVLHLIEECLPLHDIHLHMSNDLPVQEGASMTDDELQALALRLADAFRGTPGMLDQLIERLPSMEPFNRDPVQARLIAEHLRT
nr:ATP-binding protein [Limobrevibacterium gyesilva]